MFGDSTCIEKVRGSLYAAIDLQRSIPVSSQDVIDFFIFIEDTKASNLAVCFLWENTVLVFTCILECVVATEKNLCCVAVFGT